MSLDWNRNGKLEAADYFITEMLDKEIEEEKAKRIIDYKGLETENGQLKKHD